MRFEQLEPSSVAAKAVQYYWIVEDDDVTPVQQKIIPDGYTEIIFHFGDPYKIKLGDKWQRQSKSLLAGQIKGHFFLENTGRTEILGIKLKPSAVAHLFDVPMKPMLDSVVDLKRATGSKLKSTEVTFRKQTDMNDRVKVVDNYFSEICQDYPIDHPVDKSLGIVFEKKGMIAVSEICKELSVGERYVEQLFQKYVGLSPKFFARIVRFSYIFQLIKDKNPDWASVVFEAGYYDQSHFIRNFKAFTGEDPSDYIFCRKEPREFLHEKIPVVRVCTIAR